MRKTKELIGILLPSGEFLNCSTDTLMNCFDKVESKDKPYCYLFSINEKGPSLSQNENEIITKQQYEWFKLNTMKMAGLQCLLFIDKILSFEDKKMQYLDY